MISYSEKTFCHFYDLSPREIKPEQVLQILQLLIEHFGHIEFIDCEKEICNYSILSIIETDDILEQRDIKDEASPCSGSGYTIKETILSQCLEPEIMDDEDFRTSIKFLLGRWYEKLIWILT